MKHKLDMAEQHIIDGMKKFIEDGINDLLNREVRPANIEIELLHHIKKVLKKD